MCFFLRLLEKTRRCRIFGQLKLLKLHISAREGMQEPMMSTTPPRWCTRVRTTAHVLSRFRRKHRLWIFDNTCLEDVGLRPKRLMFDPFFIFFHILGSFFHMVKKKSHFIFWDLKGQKQAFQTSPVLLLRAVRAHGSFAPRWGPWCWRPGTAPGTERAWRIHPSLLERRSFQINKTNYLKPSP